MNRISGKCPVAGPLWLGRWAVTRRVCVEGCLWDHPLGMHRVSVSTSSKNVGSDKRGQRETDHVFCRFSFALGTLDANRILL